MQRELLARGAFPQAGSSLKLGKPMQLSQEQRDFVAKLVEQAAPEADTPEREGRGNQEAAAPEPLSRIQLLACFGLSEEALALQVSRLKQRKARKRAALVAEDPPDSNDSVG